MQNLNTGVYTKYSIDSKYLHSIIFLYKLYTESLTYYYALSTNYESPA